MTAQYRVRVVCAVLELSKSSYYCAAVENEGAEVLRGVEAIAAQFPTYGSRRIAAQLRRAPYGLKVNRKRVQRIMRQQGLVCRKKKGGVRTTNSRHEFARFENLVAELVIDRPDQVWVADITYVRLGSGEFVYLAVVMDLFTRVIRGWSLSRGLGVELSLSALQQALCKGAPEIHHSDQGVHYACPGYVETLHARRVRVSMAEVGCAEQNGHAERVIRTIKEEEVYLNEYRSYEEALARIGDFIEAVYNRKRIHSRLGYLTPAEFEAQWRKQQAASKKKSTQPTVQV